MAAAASENGYSLLLLRLLLAAYRLLRSVGMDGVFSRRVQAVRGIMAGSGFATTELRVLLQGVKEQVQMRWRSGLVNLKLHVDDLTIAVSGAASIAIKLLAAVVDFVVRILQDKLLLEVPAKKSVIVGSRTKVANLAVCQMRHGKVRTAKYARLLGTGAMGERRMSVRAFQNPAASLLQNHRQVPYHAQRRC